MTRASEEAGVKREVPGPVGQDVSHRACARFEEPELRARMEAILNRHPAVGLAVGVVRGGSLEFFHPHGFADIASNTPVDADTVFRIASVTKLFTAVAVTQLYEQGLVDFTSRVWSILTRPPPTTCATSS